jgi:hypothetical protein
MDTRQQVIQKLRGLIARSRADGGVVSTSFLARTLLAEFPGADISREELESLVAMEAAKGGIAVSFDGPG